MAKVAEKPLAFMGKGVDSVRIEGGEPFERPRATVLTRNSYVHFYGDGSASLIHFRRPSMFKSADVLAFSKGGKLESIVLSHDLSQEYDVRSKSRDGEYEVKESGCPNWSPSKSWNLSEKQDRRVRAELEKAWEYYTVRNDIAELVSALRSSQQVQDELARLPLHSAGTPRILE